MFLRTAIISPFSPRRIQYLWLHNIPSLFQPPSSFLPPVWSEVCSFAVLLHCLHFPHSHLSFLARLLHLTRQGPWGRGGCSISGHRMDDGASLLPFHLDGAKLRGIISVSENPEPLLKRNILIIHWYLGISVESEDFLISRCPHEGMKVSPMK